MQTEPAKTKRPALRPATRKRGFRQSVKRVAILADTPNIFRSIRPTRGQTERPDYRRIYRQGECLGRISQAIAFVNAGVDPSFAEALSDSGSRSLALKPMTSMTI